MYSEILEPKCGNKKFIEAVNKFLEEIKKRFLAWFDEVECYFNKRVDEFVSSF